MIKMTRSNLLEQGSHFILASVLSFILLSICFSSNAIAQPELILNASGNVRFLGSAKNKILFAADKGSIYQGLYKTDGTKKGTKLIKNFFKDKGYIADGGDAKLGLPTIGGKLIFVARTGKSGWGLWSSDGTEKGTKTFFPKVGNFNFTDSNFIVFNDKLIFSLYRKKQYALWMTDGTKKGTAILKVLETYRPSQDEDAVDPVYNDFFTPTANGFLFSHATPQREFQLWFSNGTPEGTSQFTTFSELSGTYTGAQLYKRWGYLGRGLVSAGASNVLFSVEATNSNGAKVVLTYLSDGALSGTLPLKLSDNSMEINPYQFMVDEGKNVGYLLAGIGSQGGTDCRFYTVDLSSRAVTERALVDVSNQPLVNCLVAFKAVINGVLFFERTSNSVGELWRTEGTQNSTQLLLSASTENNLTSNAQNILGRLLFVARYGDYSNALWQSDGTVSGTVPVVANAKVFSPTSQAIFSQSIGSSALLVGGFNGRGAKPYSFQAQGSTVQRIEP